MKGSQIVTLAGLVISAAGVLVAYRSLKLREHEQAPKDAILPAPESLDASTPRYVQAKPLIIETPLRFGDGRDWVIPGDGR